MTEPIVERLSQPFHSQEEDEAGGTPVLQCRELSIRIPGPPVPQPRQRVRVIESGDRSFVQNYTPKAATVNIYKSHIQHETRLQWRGVPTDDLLVVSLDFIFPRPKSMRAGPRQYRSARPDCDNLAKAVLDALNRVVYRDDSQVVDVRARKWIAGRDEEPRTEIWITILPACGTVVPTVSVSADSRKAGGTPALP